MSDKEVPTDDHTDPTAYRPGTRERIDVYAERVPRGMRFFTLPTAPTCPARPRRTTGAAAPRDVKAAPNPAWAKLPIIFASTTISRAAEVRFLSSGRLAAPGADLIRASSSPPWPPEHRR
jgi:hypothetical protein